MDKIERIFEKLINNKLTEWLSNHKWCTLGTGVCLVGGAIGMIMGFDMVVEGKINFFLTVPFILLLASGAGLILLSLNTEGMGGYGGFGVEKKSTTKNAGVANTINIIVKKDVDGKRIPSKITFSHSKKPFGQPRKLENDGKYYYVHILDIDKHKMIDLILPDTIYLDPHKYVIPLTMPADEAYWKPILTTWQKLAPAALVITIVIEWIVYITTRGE